MIAIALLICGKVFSAIAFGVAGLAGLPQTSRKLFPGHPMRAAIIYVICVIIGYIALSL